MEDRPSQMIYEAMLSCKDEIVSEHVGCLSAPGNRCKFPSYQQFDAKSLRIRGECIYEMFELVLLNGNRALLLCYTNFMAKQSLKEGVRPG